MESQPQNPEFRNNHESFPPCMFKLMGMSYLQVLVLIVSLSEPLLKKGIFLT